MYQRLLRSPFSWYVSTDGAEQKDTLKDTLLLPFQLVVPRRGLLELEKEKWTGTETGSCISYNRII